MLILLLLPETTHCKRSDDFAGLGFRARAAKMWRWTNPLRVLKLYRYPNLITVVSFYPSPWKKKKSMVLTWKKRASPPPPSSGTCTPS